MNSNSEKQLLEFSLLGKNSQNIKDLDKKFIFEGEIGSNIFDNGGLHNYESINK